MVTFSSTMRNFASIYRTSNSEFELAYLPQFTSAIKEKI